MGQSYKLFDGPSREFGSCPHENGYEVGGSHRDLQQHLLPVLHHHGARAGQRCRPRDHRKATAKQGMGGVGNLYFREVIGKWVLEGGIKT
jgi:hypothetical protein